MESSDILALSGRDLRLVLTINELHRLAGTQTFTYLLATHLKRRGVDLLVYTFDAGYVSASLREQGVAVTTDAAEIARFEPDVIHAQHNATAVLMRAVLPSTPMVFHSHGVLPAAEHAPSIALGIFRYLAVSEEVRDRLILNGVAPHSTVVLRNPVDTQRFSGGRPLRRKPRTALVLGRDLRDAQVRHLARTCSSLGVRLKTVGIGNRDTRWAIERLIGQVDIVFALGRGAIEAMSCGRAVYVWGHSGADGWITPSSIDELQKCNFSGRRFARPMSSAELRTELLDYDARMGEENRALVLDRFAIDSYVDRLLDVYGQALRGHIPSHDPLPVPELLQMAGRLAKAQIAVTRIRRLQSTPAGRAASVARRLAKNLHHSRRSDALVDASSRHARDAKE